MVNKTTAPAADPRTPVVDTATASRIKEIVNRFLAHFPLENVLISHDPQPPDAKPWSDGTICRTLAKVQLELGATGMMIPGCRIVYKQKNGGKSFDLMTPSAGRAAGAFHVPFLTCTKGTDTFNDWENFKKLVVARYLAERAAAVAAGATSIGKMIPAGIPVTDDQLSELGID